MNAQTRRWFEILKGGKRDERLALARQVAPAVGAARLSALLASENHGSQFRALNTLIAKRAADVPSATVVDLARAAYAYGRDIYRHEGKKHSVSVATIGRIASAGLSLSNRAGRYEDTVSFANDVITDFVRVRDTKYLPDVYAFKVEALISLKRFAEAWTTVREAEQYSVVSPRLTRLKSMVALSGSGGQGGGGGMLYGYRVPIPLSGAGGPQAIPPMPTPRSAPGESMTRAPMPPPSKVRPAAPSPPAPRPSMTRPPAPAVAESVHASVEAPGEGAAPDETTERTQPSAPATRTAWPHVSCAPSVVVGTPFDLEIGLGAERDPELGGTGKLLLPAAGCDLDVQVMYDPAAFALTQGDARFELKVTTEQPYPRRTVKLVALAGPNLNARRELGVAYSVAGVVRGYASRTVTVAATAGAPEPAAPVAAGPMFDLAAPRPEEEADLTLIIKRGDDTGAGRLVFTARSPHVAMPVEEKPPTSELGSEPAQFLQHVIDVANGSHTGWELFRALKGLGRDPIAAKLPSKIKDMLRAVAAHVAPRPASVLLVSDDPYVPWELAVIEPPLVSTAGDASPFLGAQVALGRWVLPSGDRPSPNPSRSLTVTDEAVVTGVYEAVQGWSRLKSAEQEASELLAAWPGTSRQVNATFEAVLGCLDGNPPADVLHFALHGSFSLSGRQDGVVLIEQPEDESLPATAVFLSPEHVASCDFSRFTRAPFVFLNACQVGAGKRSLGEYSGLAKSFLFAGASAVVAPLWSIDDGDARQLAVNFYADAWNGPPLAELLRRQRAGATEAASRKGARQHGFGTHLAYQFFGHPKYVLQRPAATEGVTP